MAATAVVNEFSGREREEDRLGRLQLPDSRCLHPPAFSRGRAGSLHPAPSAGGGGGSLPAAPLALASQAEPLLLLLPALRRLRAAPLPGLPAGAALRLALRALLPWWDSHGRRQRQPRRRQERRGRRARDGAGLPQARIRVHLHGAVHRRRRGRDGLRTNTNQQAIGHWLGTVISYLKMVSSPEEGEEESKDVRLS